MKRPPAPLETLLVPLAPIYAGVMRARNLGYAQGWLKSQSATVPVISIGNLTAGGTGKTPLTALLVEGLLSRGIRVGVISRGYRGTSPGLERVTPDGTSESAKRFGDEPTWLAQRFPSVPVYVGTDKVAVCRTLTANEKVDLILADDAFQHRRLKRSLDMVVIDATEPEWHYRSLPLGRMREGFDSLERADFVFLTKVNQARADRVSWLRKEIKEGLREKSGRVPIFEMESVITAFAPLGAAGQRAGDGLREASKWHGRRVLLVSGIGRPATFESSVRHDAGADVAKHLIFADHHVYTADDQTRILAEARRLQVDDVIITEKDAVKLAGWMPSTVSVWVSRLETRPRSDLGAFYEAAHRLLL